MTVTSNCTSWLGHHFEARYSETLPDISDLFSGGFKTSVHGMSVFLDSIKSKTYEGDVCTRCGCVVNKRNPAPETDKTQA